MQQTSTGVSWVASTRGWKFHMFIIYVGSRGRLDCSNVILITSYNNSSIVRTVWYIGSTGSSCHTSHTVWKREKEKQKDRERERERDLWWRGWWQIQFTGGLLWYCHDGVPGLAVRDWRAEYWSGGCTLTASEGCWAADHGSRWQHSAMDGRQWLSVSAFTSACNVTYTGDVIPSIEIPDITRQQGTGILFCFLSYQSVP